jgi:putative ABC transport system permease protein
VNSRTLRKSILREFKSSPGRFIAIFCIMAIGAGFFAGIGCTAPSMLLTADNDLSRARLADFRLVSTMGITADDVAALAAMDGIAEVMPRYAFQAKVKYEDAILVCAVKSLPENPEKDNPGSLNQLRVDEGRLPEKAGECAADKKTGLKIGEMIEITDEMEGGDISMLRSPRMKIVGLVNSPEYITYARGSTTLGSGVVNSFLYLSNNAFDSEVWLEVCIRLKDTQDISSFIEEYRTAVSGITPALKDFGAARAELRYHDIVSKAASDLADADAELSDGRAEADEKFAEALTEIEKGEGDYDAGLAKYRANLAEIESGEAALAEGRAGLAESKAQLDAGKAQCEEGQAQIADARTGWEAARAEWEEGRAQLEAAKAGLALIPPGPLYDRTAAQIAANEQELAKSEALLAANDLAFTRQEEALALTAAQLDAAEQQAAAAEQQLAETGQKLAEGRRALENANAELTRAKAEIESGRAEYERSKAETEQELADAQGEIEKGRADLEALEPPEWFVFTREDNPGYNTLEPNAKRIASMGRTVPPFMFLVAALVCLTTMTRLVEEHRTNIGTLKALGVPRRTIIAKYLFYALTVSVAGSAAGVILGVLLFPRNIWGAYGALYNLGDFDLKFEPLVIAIALLAGIAATCAATFASCAGALKSPAAELMRPKAPKPGKRVLLEHIPILWAHLAFSQKATLRNLFRYKKRLIMTVVGVAGCCALLLTSLGLVDSIAGIADRQFSEINHYDISVLLAGDADRSAMEQTAGRYGTYFLLAEESASASCKGVNTSNYSVYIMTPEDAGTMPEFISFFEPKGHRAFTLESGESPSPRVVLNEKLANMLGAKAGDMIELTNAGGKTSKVLISGVCLNYIYNYIYMTRADYEQAFGEQPDFKTILLRLDETYSGDIDGILAGLIETDGVEYAYSSNSVRDIVNEISDNLNTVVLIMRNMAAILAIVVLYNLININITEREREIATLKVLGYRRGEVFSYFFWESMILTAIGVFFGLFVGIGLHSYVMQAIETDEVAFVREIRPLSFLLAALFTLGCCVLVNIFMQPKLQRIEPVSSLKSPE